MSTSISVNKQSVLELLKTGVAKPFVIPEYQRPYAWTNEEAETLFDDIWEFATTIGGLKRDGSYFLGCIVSFDNHGEQEIIDGQQRITSLFLLLRAIYTKLIKSEDADTEVISGEENIAITNTEVPVMEYFSTFPKNYYLTLHNIHYHRNN